MGRDSYTVTKGPVWFDLGYSPEEASELFAKSELVLAIDDTITKRKLTQKKAASICHTDQPTLSKVLSGGLHLVTIDRLTSWLTLLGRSVEIRIQPYRKSQETGRLMVTA